MAKITREKFKTYKNVFDQHAERLLFELSSKGHFDNLQSPVSIGKEANIFTALKGNKRIIAKIYRLETCDFNTMYSYIRYDTRYLNLKRNRRRVIFAWCQREFRNLLKAREAGLKVPTPIAFKDNVLLMEFIGNKDAAPKLKDAYPNNPKKFANTVVDYMAKFYKAGMIHGDLSEFNILNLNNKPVIIDLSQASPVKSTNAEELLERDIINVCRFFKKLKVDMDKDKIKEKIKK